MEQPSKFKQGFRVAVSLSVTLLALALMIFVMVLTADWQANALLLILTTLGCMGIAAIFLVFTIKIIKTRSPQLKRAGKIGIVIGTMLMILLPLGGFAFINLGHQGFLDESYLWNDGPWLNFGDDPTTEMTISWLTNRPTEAKINFGNSADSLEPISSNTPNSNLHHVFLTNLIPNTRYYYSINQKFSADHMEQVFSFKTAPTTDEAFKVIIVGDMQPGPDDTLKAGNLVAQGIAAENPDLVLQLGDLTHNGGTPSAWHHTMQNFPLYAANTPFQMAVGNHDYGSNGDRNVRNVFPIPYPSDVGLYYSFDYASAHFVMVDNFDNGNYTMTESQKEWVENDIIDAKARGQKWIFVQFHHTILTTGTSGQNWDLQSWMVPLADKYDVDGIFFGHDHHYEYWNYTYGSTGLLYNENDLPSGNSTEYWCTGGGGAHLEVDYGLLTHEPWDTTRSFYNISASEYQNITHTREAWNPDRVVENEEHEIYAASASDGLYYHAPDLESYSTDNDLYGYQYGENTRHYMKIEMEAGGNSCTISANYPNGDILEGPGGSYPQIWTFTK